MKRSQVLLIAAAAIIIGLFWFIWTHHREPSYEGRSLSEWLRLYRQPIGAKAPAISQEAADAVRHIGTNAVPFLVSWIQTPQQLPPWRERLFQLVYRWRFGAPGREVLLESIATPRLRAARSMWGFAILGETARAAVPDLVRVASKGDRSTASNAIIALGHLGDDGLPPLLSMITNTAFPFRIEALASLGQMGYLGTNAHVGVVVLIRCLKDPYLAFGAADILGRLHLESDLSVPALTQCTHSTNLALRIWGVISLGRFGPSARAAVPELTQLLNDPEPSVRNEATNALKLISPEAPQQISAP